MHLSVNRGLAARALLVLLCAGSGACKQDAEPTKVDPEQPLVQRPRRPETERDSPIRHPDRDPPAGRDGEQIADAEIETALAEFETAAESGNRVVASQKLAACANKTPASARCDGELGLLLADVAPRKAEALYYLSEAARTDDPKATADLYGRLAQALRQRGLNEDAISAAELALAREDTAARHLELSRVLQSTPEQLPRAAEELGKAVAAQPDDYELLYEQATVVAQLPGPEAATQSADLFQRYLDQAAPTGERKDTTIARIAELRGIAKRIAQEQKRGGKKSG